MLDYLRRASVPTDLLGIIAEVRRRWRLKLALRGVVRVLAILVVIAGSMDTQEGASSFIAGIEDRLRNAPLALRRPVAKIDGLRWAVPKTDKLVIPSGAVATRSYIPDGIRQRRGNRDGRRRHQRRGDWSPRP